MTVAYLLDADSETILSIGTKPDLHKELLKKREHGEWQFPVIIRLKDAKPWDDTAYLNSMRPDQAKTEEAQTEVIKQAHKDGYHSMRTLAEKTGIYQARVSFLVHKLSLPLVNDYWRSEAYNDPTGIVTNKSAKGLAQRLGVLTEDIVKASKTNGLIFGYYISKVGRL